MSHPVLVRATTIAVFLFLLLGASLRARASEPVLKLRGGVASAVIGWTWGEGTLEFDGRRYSVQTRGLTLGQVGGAHSTASGRVRNLRQISDLAGTYAVAEAGATIGLGRRLIALRNEKGVVITMTTNEQGALMGLGGALLRIHIDATPLAGPASEPAPEG